MRVGIVGVGWFGFRPRIREYSFREMMFEAALRAYEDAGSIDPRRDVDAFVSCQEDFWEGIAIADEFAPEPVGGTLKPVFTVTGDGLQCVGNAHMLLRTGYFDVVVVESHAKPSDIVGLGSVVNFALDPVMVRPLGIPNYHALAAMEARTYMGRYGVREEALAQVVVKDKGNALLNERASYGVKLTVDEVISSKIVSDPLRELDIAQPVDASVVVVMATEDVARDLTDTPIWIDGIHWVTEGGSLEHHNWSFPIHAVKAAEGAYAMAKIHDPFRELSMAEVDNRYSFKELQFIEALRITPPGEASKWLMDGIFEIDGRFPVNPSGGALGEGLPLEVHGLARLLNSVLQLRGEAGKAQLDRVEKVVIHSWRGIPTTTSTVAVLSRN